MTISFRIGWVCLLLPLSALGNPSFVGSAACQGCHAVEYKAWQGSHHERAMQVASDATVLGDFGGADFKYAGTTSRFFRDEHRFMVRTEGADGEPADFEVSHTFGVAPLQQYLVTFPDGRLQALNIAWDSRPASQGGQRWFHLYPGEDIDHEDPLHWTGSQLNWNFMCADCHSTDLRKNYSSTNDTFATTWSEISVGCESCHGPGQPHLAWAQTQSEDTTANNGLHIVFDDRANAHWSINEGAATATRNRPIQARKEVETCAACHSRRISIAAGAEGQGAFLQHFMPALLTEDLYHADGQIQDEVFVWGSFIQSRMFDAGVTCSDCHDPHSQELRLPGNATCLQCHSGEAFNSRVHHHHEVESSAGECVSCHMPATDYMVVDPRRDHSFRVPRPDLSLEFGTPNACNGCHQEKSVEWAAEQFRAWYPDVGKPFQDWTEAFSKARRGDRSAAPLLRDLAANISRPEIARATALRELMPFLDQTALPVLQAALRDDSALVRMAAVGVLESVAPGDRYALASHLLDDPVRTVRIEAGRVLAPAMAQLTQAQQARVRTAVTEYAKSQEFHADRAESQANLGNLYRNLMEYSEAVTRYRKATVLDPHFSPAWVNLSDLFRSMGQDDQAIAVLREAVQASPSSGLIRHSLGLAQVRNGDTDAAVNSLGMAARLEPESARFTYVYAVALHSTGQLQTAIDTLVMAHDRHPHDRDILLALTTFHRDGGQLEQARSWADKLLALDPGNPQYRQLRASLD